MEKEENSYKVFDTEFESFIGAWFIPTKSCSNLIKLFKKQKKLGHTRKGQHAKVKNNITKFIIDKKIKDSEDCTFWPNCDLKEIITYRQHLQQCLNRYMKKYPETLNIDKYNIVENIQIQHYKKGGGYKSWHMERGGPIASRRVLVFMTYLNTVEDGGTQFKYQKYICPAKEGLTLIWPTDFTHTHRGQISLTKEKYIITGWFSFLND